MICECVKCGRLHQHLGRPPWALSHDDLMRLSRRFNTDYRTAQDQRINDWLKRLIAEADDQPTSGPYERLISEMERELMVMTDVLREMLDDHMTSETHHPGYVLVPKDAFEKARAALSPKEGG